MKIRKDFLLAHDFDWFCVVSGIPIQVASAGGAILPDLVNDREKLIDSQILASELPSIYDDNQIYINKELIIRKLLEDDLEDKNDYNNVTIDVSMEDRVSYYAHSFIPYAKKGFYCFDRSFPEDNQSTLYDLITFPKIMNCDEEEYKFPSTSNQLVKGMKTPQWVIDNIRLFENLDFSKIII